MEGDLFLSAANLRLQQWCNLHRHVYRHQYIYIYIVNRKKNIPLQAGALTVTDLLFVVIASSENANKNTC